MTDRPIQRRAAFVSSLVATVIAVGCGTTDPGGVSRFAGVYDVTTTLQTYSYANGIPVNGNPYAKVSIPSGAAATYGTMLVREFSGPALVADLTMHETPCLTVTTSCGPVVAVYSGTVALDSTLVFLNASSLTEALTLFWGVASGDSIAGAFEWVLGFGPGVPSLGGTYVARRHH